MDLKQLQTSLSASFEALSKRYSSLSTLLKAALAVCSLALVIIQISGAGAWTAWNVVGIGVASLGIVLSVIVTALDKNSPHELEIARKAVERAQEATDTAEAARAEALAQEQQLRAFEADLIRPVELYRAIFDMSGVVEQSIAHDAPVDTAIATLLRISYRSLRIACDFDIKAHHTICIYVAESDPEVQGMILRCIAQDRSTHCELEQARRWRPRVGMAGTTFALARECIAADMNDEDERRRYFEQPIDIDHARYTSLAGVPIYNALRPEAPWGVVVASSSRPRHFVAGARLEGLDPVEPIRTVARLCGIIVTAADRAARDSVSD